eukprot:190072_1
MSALHTTTYTNGSLCSWNDLQFPFPYHSEFVISDELIISDEFGYEATSSFGFDLNVSIIGRHEFSKHDALHKYFFMTHGSLAIVVWILFFLIWFSSFCKFGSKQHKIMGNILFYCLLITEVS